MNSKSIPTIREAIAETLRRRVREDGCRQADFARKAGIPQQHLSDYLYGRRGLGPERIERLMSVLGLGIRPVEEQE